MTTPNGDVEGADSIVGVGQPGVWNGRKALLVSALDVPYCELLTLLIDREVCGGK